MIKLFDAKEGCCGCSACKTICPVTAIEFYRDEEGFEYPRIEHDKCISCGRCVRVCDFTKKIDDSRNPIKIYAAKIKDEIARKRSSSGGMFIAFSDYILSRGGAVYGAAHNDKLETIHIRAADVEQRDRCIGSKYVQSSMGDSFSRVRNDLKSERDVFFTGTPCQVAGLRRYLDNSRCPTERLFTADLVCHGVPTPMLFQEFIKFCENKTHKKVKDYIHRPYAQIEFIGAKQGSSNISLVWARLYGSLGMSRPSCLKCKYTSSHRYGDITIGDFWGIEDTMPDFYEERGVSLLFINTDRGMKTFNAVRESLIVRESNLEACLPRNPNLAHPSAPYVDREKFWSIYNEKGFEALAKHYGGYGLKHSIKRAVRYGLEKAHLLNFALSVKNTLKNGK